MSDVTGIINFLSNILEKQILPLLIGVAVVAFVYGILQYFLNPDNEEKRKKGKEYLVWGLVGLFVMVSFWGIIAIFQNTFIEQGLDNQIKVPKIPQQ